MNMYRSLRKTVVLIALTVFMKPAFSQDVNAARSESSSSSSEQSENGVRRWNTSTGVTSFNIETRGKVEVTDDDRDVKSLSNDGYLQITKTVFGSKRAIIIESIGGGKIKKEYFEGRTKMEWEPNGSNWLHEILPEIVRSTTLSAESRVNRIFAREGVNGVLNELSKLEGDHTRAHYAKLLMDKNISASEMPGVITKISEVINSDYYLSTVYQDGIQKMLATQDASDAFFRGSKKIGSAYYKSEVLKSALKKNQASPNQIKTILQTASDIDSDYYLSVVLSSLLDQRDVKDESLNQLVIVSKKIPSDHYRSQVLNKALQKTDVSKVVLKNVVNAVSDVNSDYYKTQVFNSMAERSNMDQDVQVQVITLVGSSVNSDYYASQTLKNILDHQKLSDESFKQLVKIGGDLNSASYASEVLKKATKRDLSKKQLIELLQACESLDSDHYLSEVLLDLSGQVKNSDSSVKDAYRKAAKNIDSETYYGRVAKAID